MKLIAAYLLLSLTKENPTGEDIKGLLDTVGVEADAERLDKLVGELNGKNLEELIAEGQEKLATVPSGGGAAAAAPAAAEEAAAPAEEAKEEAKEEEEEDEDMGFGLFE